jgi:hypothetical protein
VGVPRSLRALLGAAAAAALCVACALPLAARRLPLGVDVGWVVGDNGAPLLTPGLAASVAASGAGLARVEFRTGPFFGGLGPGHCPPSSALCAREQLAGWSALYAAYDHVVANLAAHHVAVLGLLDYTTVGGGQAAWTADNAEHGQGDGTNPYTRAFAATAAQIMAHYRGRIRYWEIWNEPNAWTRSAAGGVYSGGSFLYPSNYAALLLATYRQAVGVDHLPVTLISGGVFGHSIGGVYSAQNAGAVYLRQVFARWKAAGVRRYPLGGIGQHLYITQGGAVTAAQVTEYLRWVHQVAVDYGLPSLPTYVTELGWTTASVGPALQARNLSVALAAARALPYVRTVVVFNLRNGPGLDYGLYAAGGQPEPALAAFRQAAAAWR